MIRSSIIVLIYFFFCALVCFVPASRNLRHREHAPGSQRSLTLSAPSPINPTYLHIVGVEGVGHHGVSPAIASIAQSCQQHVVYEHQTLRTFLTQMSSLKFKFTLTQLAKFWSPKSVLFIEDASFPTGRVHRYSPDNAKREFGLYNINWLYDQAKQADVDIKFLHLTRDFYRAVASHPEFDGGFEKHAQVLHNFTSFIDTEYRSIEAKESGLWRQIKYEWFTEMEDCPALVSAIVDFMGWRECNLARACDILREDLRPPTQREVNQTQYKYAQQFDVNVSVPLLDLFPTKNYSFINNTHLPDSVVVKPRVSGLPRWVPDLMTTTRNMRSVQVVKAAVSRVRKSAGVVVVNSTTTAVRKRTTPTTTAVHHAMPTNVTLVKHIPPVSPQYRTIPVPRTPPKATHAYRSKSSVVHHKPLNSSTVRQVSLPTKQRVSSVPHTSVNITVHKHSPEKTQNRVTVLQHKPPDVASANRRPVSPIVANRTVVNRQKVVHRSESNQASRPVTD